MSFHRAEHMPESSVVENQCDAPARKFLPALLICEGIVATSLPDSYFKA